MQTFLPYPSFTESARCLDSRRLGKQRVECLQIIRALNGYSKGWVNHPATLMWRGYIPALRKYMDAVITEWMRRGYKNTITFNGPTLEVVYPPWLGDPAFHDSHKSNLLRKAPFYYSQFNWNVPDNLEYVWPRGD
jgi:hypothetical protein